MLFSDTHAQIMNSFWQVTPDYVIWSSYSRTLNLILMVVHTACWMSIATSVFTIDYLELLGIKQVMNTDYCIAGNFGEVFNLAVWRIR